MTRILIIDDEDEIRALMQQVLNGAGYETVAAAEGREALALQRKKPADLVITDLMMPGQEGLETIIEMRRIFPATKIIAMSGGGQGGTLDFLPMATQLGAARTLAKPFTHAGLLGIVREVLAT